MVRPLKYSSLRGTAVGVCRTCTGAAGAILLKLHCLCVVYSIRAAFKSNCGYFLLVCHGLFSSSVPRGRIREISAGLSDSGPCTTSQCPTVTYSTHARTCVHADKDKQLTHKNKGYSMLVLINMGDYTLINISCVLIHCASMWMHMNGDNRVSGFIRCYFVCYIICVKKERRVRHEDYSFHSVYSTSS